MRTFLNISAGSIYATALMLLVSMISCDNTKEENIKPVKETVSIHLNAPETKTGLVNDQTVVWTNGDRVLINKKTYEVTVDTDNPASATVENVTKADEYYAVFVPHYKNAANELIPDYMYHDNAYHLPILQFSQFSQGTFDQYANPMVAYGTDTNLHFYNIGSVIKVGLTGNGETIESLNLISNGSTNISGLIKVTDEQIRTCDFSSVTVDEDYSNYLYDNSAITCEGANVVLSSSPTWFYFVTAPFTDESGISLLVKDIDDNIFIKTKTDAFSCKRSEVKEMSVLDYKAAAPITLTGGEHKSNSISVSANGENTISIRYIAVTQSTWDEYVKSYKEEAANIIMVSFATIETSVGPSTFELTKAYNSTKNLVAITAGTAYKVIAQYNIKNYAIGKCAVIDAVTPAAEGPAPTLEVEGLSSSSDRIYAHLKTDGASASIWLFEKTAYEALQSEGKSDSDIMNNYGKALTESELAAANADGCQWSWQNLWCKTDYVILFKAVSAEGKDAVIKKTVSTTYHIFDPTITVLETVSTTGTVVTDMFDNFEDEAPELKNFTIKNLTIKKIPSMDVFVIDNLFKGRPALQTAGFKELDGNFSTIIDARNPSSVDIRLTANRIGIYHPKYLGLGENFAFGCYASYADVSEADFPLGIYDQSSGQIDFSSIVSGDGTRVYGIFNFRLILNGADSFSIESFTKSKTSW